MARPQIAMAHTVSLICEGVFEKFPNFRFLFIEHDTLLAAGIDVAHGCRLEIDTRLYTMGKEATK